MNWKTIHTLMTVCIAAAGALPALAHTMPAVSWPWFVGIGGALSFMGIILGAVSDSVLPPKDGAQ